MEEDGGISVKPEDFLKILRSIPESVAPHRAGPREMWNAELYFICRSFGGVNPSLVFESGVWNGRSTAIICAVAREYNCNVVSCCTKRNPRVEAVDKYFENLTMVYGRGEKILPRFDPEIVVSDGPKCNVKDGIQLLTTAVEKESVKAIFQHDVHKEPDGKNFRKVAKTHNRYFGLITEEFLREHQDLDGELCHPYLGFIF